MHFNLEGVRSRMTKIHGGKSEMKILAFSRILSDGLYKCVVVGAAREAKKEEGRKSSCSC